MTEINFFFKGVFGLIELFLPELNLAGEIAEDFDILFIEFVLLSSIFGLIIHDIFIHSDTTLFEVLIPSSIEFICFCVLFSKINNLLSNLFISNLFNMEFLVFKSVFLL